MKAFNKAVFCLAATTLSLNAAALMPVANLNARAESAKPVSQTIRMLQEDPLLVHTLDLSDDEKNDLMDQVIRASENQAAEQAGENQGLIHKANFFEQLFGGGQQYENRPHQPLDLQPQRPPDYGAIKMPVSPNEPAIIFNHDSMQDPNDWKVKYFDVVVVINKARTGQRLIVYKKEEGGMPVAHQFFQRRSKSFLTAVKISTGREGVELSNEDRYAAGMAESDHAPKSSYFSNTPTGYFTPIRFSIDHVSGDWEDAAMDHAVFFHPRGIATHKAPNGTEGQLGRRASGACVRMDRFDARDLFWLIRRTGGPVTSGEMAGGNFKRSSQGPSFAAQLREEQAKGFNTYIESPTIPVFDRNGNIKNAVGEDGAALVDENGQPVPAMRKALARTLIVVENREIARAPKKKKK